MRFLVQLAEARAELARRAMREDFILTATLPNGKAKTDGSTKVSAGRRWKPFYFSSFPSKLSRPGGREHAAS